MFSYLKSLLKDSAIYSLGNILNKAAGLYLLPIYSVFIPIGEFGILTILELIILALIQICNLGLTAGFQRYFFIEKENKNLGSFIFSSLTTIILVYAPFLILGLLFSEQLSEFIFDSSQYQFCLQLVSGIILFEMLSGIQQQYFQNEQRTILYTCFNVGNTILTLAMSVYLIKYKGWGIEGVLLSRFISKVISTFLSLFIFILPKLKFRFNSKTIKKSISYGFPIVISSIGYIVYTMSDRFMILELTDADNAGKYGFAVRIASVINIVFIQALGLGFLPEIFKNENNKRLYSKTYTYYIYGISIIILGFLMTYKLPLSIVMPNPEYLEGLSIIPLLSLYYLLLGSNYFLYSGISTSNRSKYLIYPTLITAIINIALNFIFIPKYGYRAAAISTVVSQFIYIIIANQIIQKINPIKFEWNRIVISIGLGSLLYILYVYLDENIFYTPLIVGIYLFIIYKFNFLDEHEKERLRNTLLKHKNKYFNS